MDKINELIDELVEQAIDYGIAKETGDSVYRFACANTMDNAREKLVKAIQEKISCKSS